VTLDWNNKSLQATKAKQRQQQNLTAPKEKKRPWAVTWNIKTHRLATMTSTGQGTPYNWYLWKQSVYTTNNTIGVGPDNQVYRKSLTVAKCNRFRLDSLERLGLINCYEFLKTTGSNTRSMTLAPLLDVVSGGVFWWMFSLIATNRVAKCVRLWIVKSCVLKLRRKWETQPIPRNIHRMILRSELCTLSSTLAELQQNFSELWQCSRHTSCFVITEFA